MAGHSRWAQIKRTKAVVDAKRGALFTFGEHKGSGLAMICELFAGALTGGGTTYPGNFEHRPIMNSMLSIIVEPSRLGGGDTVGAEAARFMAALKDALQQAAAG